MKVEQPEIQKQLDIKKFINNLIGFDKWCEKNKQKHYDRYRQGNRRNISRDY